MLKGGKTGRTLESIERRGISTILHRRGRREARRGRRCCGRRPDETRGHPSLPGRECELESKTPISQLLLKMPENSRPMLPNSTTASKYSFLLT